MQRLLLPLALLSLTAAAQPAPPSCQAVRTTQPPVIDGILDDPCWREQTLVNNFRDVKTGEAVQTQTRFIALFDNDNLYLAVICDEPDMANLRAKLAAPDDALWTDDCVEVFLDPTNQRQTYAHLIVNPKGALYDAWVTHAGAAMDVNYESGALAAAGTAHSSWQVELCIPYVGLRLSRDTRPTWAFNICREKKTSPTELSCWSPPFADGFHHPASFGTLTGLQVNFRPHMLIVDSPTFQEPHFDDGQLLGTLAIPCQNWTARDIGARVSASFTNIEGGRADTIATPIIRRGAGRLLIPVVVGKPGVVELQLQIYHRDTQKLLHRSRHSMTLQHQAVDITFLKPAYRDTIYATLPSSEIVCRLKVNLPRRELSGTELRVTFNSGVSELSVRRVPRLSALGEAEVAFSSEIVPAGEYLIKAQALKRGQVVAEGQKLVRKVRPQHNEVVVDHQGRLLVAGQPFYPLGFMGAEPDERLARAGFNTIHTYINWYIHRDKDLTAWLDQARLLGLKVIMPPYPGETDSYGFRGKPTLTDQDLADIRAFVDQYKQHPALLAWYMCDEPRGALWRANLRKVYETVADADPYHPCVALDNSAASLLQLEPVADILWIDPYPGFATGGGPKQPLTMVAQALTDVRAGLRRPRPIWIAPQAFSYAEWDRAQEVFEREPNLSEIRCMHYLALLNGADGIIPFAWAYAQRHASTRLTYLESIGPEMALLLPALLHGAELSGCRARPLSTQADVQVKAWKYENNFFIVAVNRRPEEGRARLIIPGLGGGWVKVLGEQRRLQARGGALDELFPPYGVHIYTDRKRTPSLISLDLLQQRIAQ